MHVNITTCRKERGEGLERGEGDLGGEEGGDKMTCGGGGGAGVEERWCGCHLEGVACWG